MTGKESIAEFVDRLGRIVHGLQFADGLNPAQWDALRFVARANRNSRSPGALAEYLGTTKGTASQTLIALESKGYIRRVRCATDRRSVEIDLTDAGSDLLSRDPLCLVEQASGEFSDDELSALAQGLDRLIAALRRAQGLTEFGCCVKCTHYLPEGGEDVESLVCRCALNGNFLAQDETEMLCAQYRPTA